MKKLLLLFFLPFANLSAQTYTYKPMLSTTDWRVETADLGGSAIYWYHQAFKITDNLKEYTAISDCEGLDPEFYIREDIASRKVFYMRANEMQEHLLFNFNLKVNDVIDVPLGLFEKNSTEFRVTSIDTINLPDGKHKRFKYRETGGLQHLTFTLIEGIGCTEEPFKVYYLTADPEFYLLNSYKGKQCLYNFKDTCPPNPCTTGTGIHAPITKTLKAWPNPCNDVLQIDSDISFRYSLFNAMGQMIQTGTCQRELDMSEMESGLYELVLEQNGEREVLRVMRE